MAQQHSSAIITGASRGLGLALARELGRRGVKLALVAQHAERLGEAVGALERDGIRAVPIRADVGEKEAIHRIVGQAQALLGPIDLVVHNASTLGPTPLRALLETECEDLSRVIEVNVLGPFRLSKAVIPSMLVHGRGTVVHVSSDAAVETYPNWGPYGLSKAALDHLSRTLALELAETPVRVLSIDPGEMDTDMHRDAIPDADPETLLRPEVVAARIARILERAERYPTGARVRAADEAEERR